MQKKSTKSTKPSGLSQNIAWTVHRGAFIAHILIIALGYFILRSLLNDSNLTLMLTPLFYNISTLIFFHLIVGDPFDPSYGGHSFWEQLIDQIGYHSSTIFFMACPIVLFFVVNHLVNWNVYLYGLNILSLIVVIIPKLGFMHRKRLFGIGSNN